MKQKQRNLHDRIRDDALMAIHSLVAAKLRRDTPVQDQQAKVLAYAADELSGDVTRHLIKHYTIRDRRR